MSSLAFFAACSESIESPSVIELARGFEPSVLPDGPTEWLAPLTHAQSPAVVASIGPLTLEPDADAETDAETRGHGVWVETHLPPAAWKRHPLPGAWRAPRPVPGSGVSDEGRTSRLFLAERELTAVSLAEVLSAPESLPPGSFYSSGGSVFLFMGSDSEAAPEEARLREWIDRGQPRNGVWRTSVGRYVADGFALLPGFPEEIATEIPPHSELRFRVASRGWARADDGTAGSLRLRVTLDGTPIEELEVPVRNRASIVAGRINLPQGGARSARIGFEATGGAAHCAILIPRLVPLDASEANPEDSSARPDIVLFLADTFRADNLAVNGGDAKLAPNLNRLVGESLAFTHVWSPSTWTLPSHATLFSGIHPHQAGVVSKRARLSEDAVTLAETLRAAGYRTGAVTDHGFVTSEYGLDQGFEWFDQEWGDLEDLGQSAARFLDDDDGRPMFLFVQTYKTHVPYLVSEETRRSHGDSLDLELDWEELQARMGETGTTPQAGDVLGEEMLRLRRAYESLYLGTVVDLDRWFGTFRQDLERRGVLPAGVLVVTSDHGEGFWEHGFAGHGNATYDEHLRIPLILHGRGIPPEVRDDPVGLIDVPSTLVRLAGARTPASWEGRDLLATPASSPALAFRCAGDPLPVVVLIDGMRKVVFTAGEEPVVLDRGSTLAEEAPEVVADWAADFVDARRTLWSRSLEPGLEADDRVGFSAEERERLRALGYLGEGEDP